MFHSLVTLEKRLVEQGVFQPKLVLEKCCSKKILFITIVHVRGGHRPLTHHTTSYSMFISKDVNIVDIKVTNAYTKSILPCFCKV